MLPVERLEKLYVQVWDTSSLFVEATGLYCYAPEIQSFNIANIILDPS